MTNPTIALTMIVKGSASTSLRRALTSCRHLFDDAVALVDMRHGDQALAVLKEFDVRADTTPFEMYTEDCIHFAKARNRSFEATEADWCFWIDADEIMECGDDLRAYVNAAHAEGWQSVAVQFKTYCGAHAGDMTPQIRAARRSDFRMKFPVHNMPIGIKSRITCALTTLRTDYAGQIADRMKRSVPALRKLFREGDGGDRKDEQAHAAYFLARMHLAAHEYAEAARWAREVVAIEPDHEGYADIHRNLVQATFMTDGFGPAWKLCINALERHPGMMDLWHQLMSMAFFAWVNAADNPKNEIFGWAQTRAHLGNAEHVAGLMAFPLKVTLEEKS